MDKEDSQTTEEGVGLHVAVEVLHMAVGVGVEAFHIMNQGGMEDHHEVVGVEVLGKEVLFIVGAPVTVVQKLPG